MADKEPAGAEGAARRAGPSRCASASEPSPPAGRRKKERRLMEKSGLIHIQKAIARQQHLAEVGPDAQVRLRLARVDQRLVTKKIQRGIALFRAGRPCESPLKCLVHPF